MNWQWVLGGFAAITLTLEVVFIIQHAIGG